MSPLTAVMREDLVSIDEHRLHRILITYIRLLTADPLIATRYKWPSTPLHLLRTQHPNSGVRLLATQALSKQRRWSEEKTLDMERKWVGDINKEDAEVAYGFEVEPLTAGGFQLKQVTISGWMLPIYESRRAKSCRSFRRRT